MITTLIKWEAGDIRILDGNYALQKHKKLGETQTSKSICTVQYFLTSFDEIVPWESITATYVAEPCICKSSLSVENR